MEEERKGKNQKTLWGGFLLLQEGAEREKEYSNPDGLIEAAGL